MVLLHGPTVYSPTAPFLGLLGRHARIVAPSHPGFGGSSRPDDFDTVYDLVRFYQDVLDTLPDDTGVLPGHMEPTTLGRERQSNPFLRELAAR